MAYNGSTKTFDTIADLRLQKGANDVNVNVLGYHSINDGGGGTFYWDNTSTDTDNNGTIIKATNISVGRWKRVYSHGEINVRWFGAKGDNTTDDTVAFQASIDILSTGLQVTGGSVYIPSGTYLLNKVIVKPGILLYSNQVAKYYFIGFLSAILKPLNTSTDYVIYFQDSCSNSALKGIYIECGGTANPNLKAAVRFTGNGCNLYQCLFNAASGTCVDSSAGNSFIRECGIFGWYGPAPIFSGINDFRGALEVKALGDAYIQDNEIGAGLPYFATYPNPMDMLRDPVNRRICAMAATGFFGTSVISGNLFENGDRGVVISGGGLYCTFHHNRYELCGGTGLTILNAGGGGVIYFTFIGERFSDNSLAGDGVFEDIFLTAGTAGYITFIAPIFEKLVNPIIPTSNFKVKWNINNQASTTIELVSPQVDSSYTLKGLINNEDIAALPVKQALLQYDINHPIWQTISTQEPVINTQKGYVTLIQGTTVAAGNYTGGVQLYDANSQPKALLGFNVGNDLWYTLNQNGGSHIFINGGMLITKAGGNTLTLNSTDNSGVVDFSMKAGPTSSHGFDITMNAVTGLTRMGGGDDLIIGLGGSGNIKYSANGTTFLPNKPNPDVLANVDILARNTTTTEQVIIPSNLFAPVSGGANYIQNQTSGVQVANFAISGVGRVDGALSVAVSAFPAYALQVGVLSSTPGISALFSGRVIISDAVNNNEAASFGQLNGYTLDKVLTAGNTSDKNIILTGATTSIIIAATTTGGTATSKLYSTAGTASLQLEGDTRNFIDRAHGANGGDLDFTLSAGATITNTIFVDGRMSGTAAINGNEFVTKSQTDAINLQAVTSGTIGNNITTNLIGTPEVLEYNAASTSFVTYQRLAHNTLNNGSMWDMGLTGTPGALNTGDILSFRAYDNSGTLLGDAITLSRQRVVTVPTRLFVGTGTALATGTVLTIVGDVGLTGNTITTGSLAYNGGAKRGGNRIVTGNYTVVAATDEYIFVNNTAACTITLPSINVGSTNFGGQTYHVKKLSGASLDVTVVVNGGQTIDGNASFVLNTAGQSKTFHDPMQADGTITGLSAGYYTFD